MQPTLQQLNQKLDTVIEMLTALVQALAEDADATLLTLDGGYAGGERDDTQPL